MNRLSGSARIPDLLVPGALPVAPRAQIHEWNVTPYSGPVRQVPELLGRESGPSGQSAAGRR